MFNLKSKRSKICFIGMLISLTVMLITFFATDDLLGDKEFSEYTHQDWSIAIFPLSILAISGISALIFSIIILFSMILASPSLIKYVTKIKFSDIDIGTEFIVFDHNEFKRACCRIDEQSGLWISIKEYNLRTRKWAILEEGRYIKNADTLVSVLQEDYKFDKTKFYNIQKRNL